MFISRAMIIFTIVGLTFGQISPADVPFRRYCSAALSEAIKLICGSNYNSFSRQLHNTAYYTSTSNNNNNNKNGESILLSKLVEANNYAWFRSPGLTHECCRRPCGYTELKSYCGPD